MIDDKILEPIGKVNGSTVYCQKDNGVGGSSYYSDHIDGGVLVYDTCLHDPVLLEFCQMHAGERKQNERAAYWRRRAEVAESLLKKFATNLPATHPMVRLHEQIMKEQSLRSLKAIHTHNRRMEIRTYIELTIADRLKQPGLIKTGDVWKMLRFNHAEHRISYSSITVHFREIMSIMVRDGRAELLKLPGNYKIIPPVNTDDAKD